MSGIFDQVINYAPPSLLLGTVTYKGTWSAATNTPTLLNPPSSITNGNYYVVSAAGTQFSLSFNIGDWIISNGSAWEKVDNTDAVSSVFGRMGAVVGVSTDYSAVGITNTALGASNPSTVAATTVTATSTIAATGAVTGSNLSGTNTGDQTITLTGGVTGSGTGSFAATVVTNANLTGDVTSSGNATTLTNAPVIAKVLTGYTSGAGTVAATDSILQAIQKLNGNDGTNANLTGVITSVGNATSIASQTGTGTKFVVDTSPVLVTPNIGVATGTSLAAALNGTLGATTPSTIAATTISGTTGTFTDTIATSQNVNGSASLSCTNSSNGVSARARVLLIADAGNAQVFATSTGYTDITGAADSMVFAANSLSGGYQFSIDGNPAVAKVTSTGLNSTAIGATTPSTGAFTTGIINLSSGSDQQETLSVRGNSGVGMLFRPSFSAGTQPNWRVAASIAAGSTLEITPSTTNGGTTFTTPVAAFTSAGAAITGTLSATGTITSTSGPNTQVLGCSNGGTGYLYQSFSNTGGNIVIGVERSTGGAIITGSTGYAAAINNSAGPIQIGANSSLVATFSSTGLAVTGTGVFSGNITTNGGSLLNNSASSHTFYQSTPTTGAQSFLDNLRVGSSFYFRTSTTTGADTTPLIISSTGLAVTGTLSASAQTTLAGAVQITTTSFPSTGAGLELSYLGGTSYLQSYSRTSSAYTPISVSGSQVNLQVAGSNVLVTTAGAAAVTGTLSCTGALSKGSGSFRIEHPLPEKSATHQLVHSFIEGPKCDLIYRGKINLVDGKASVNIDTDSTMTEGTFEVLCRNVQCFTSNESGWGAIRGKVVGNILTIEAQDSASTDNVSWMVIGERKDKHILDTDWTDKNGRPIVEPLKPAEPALESK